MASFSEFIDFLLKKGYTLIKSDEKLKTVIYLKDGLFIKIVQDPNFKRFISLSRTNNHPWEGWYDMTIVRFFILQKHYEKDSFLWFEQLSVFFTEYHEEIVDAFGPSRFPKTEFVLKALKKERGKLLFGFD